MPNRRASRRTSAFGIPASFYLAAAGILLAAALAISYFSPYDEPAATSESPEATTAADSRETTTEPTVATRLLGEGEGELISPEEAETQPEVVPGSENLTLSVPKLGLEGIPVPTGSTQERLDAEGILRMSGSGLPWESGTNTFIVGHTLGYQGTKVPYVFYELDEMKPGDVITLEDSSGNGYEFRVFDEVTLRPEDYWVTQPDREGRTIVSLQSCVPIPEFDMRLVVQAELVES